MDKGTHISGGIFLEISKVDQVETPALETCVNFFLLPLFVLVFFRDTACLFVEKPCLWAISLPPLERHPHSPPVSPFFLQGSLMARVCSRWLRSRQALKQVTAPTWKLVDHSQSAPGTNRFSCFISWRSCVRAGGSKLGPELSLVLWVRCWRC